MDVVQTEDYLEQAGETSQDHQSQLTSPEAAVFELKTTEGNSAMESPEGP
eukprot:CAMPEP_0185574130 /NCGR_PEP_ID=MMETSP0434-20130131/5674_1 /TAXON_ID=626734 ORGANISM="Favella taraikaensis, Strain Fe Narragansett Bay" /NCGR_SAMPLE_ID=MMETSP0434 /ASSEMBLY_ACC=CAM_ASM_000379 /LENGTH=49 /DNA_ID=CAMNT_0028190605 /DNA_START=609 /DNA_END=758 /DNA_ORIENTATION=+